MKVNPVIADFILKRFRLLLRSDFVISIFSECDIPTVDIMDDTILLSKKELLYHTNLDDIYYVGKVLLDNDKNLFYITEKSQDKISVKLLSKNNEYSIPIVPSYHDEIDILPSLIPNVTKKITTTWGKLILNVLLTITPFDDIEQYPIEYRNESPFDIDSVLTEYNDLLLSKKIPVSVVHSFFNNLDYLQMYCDIFIPSLGEKMLTVDKELRKKLKKLLKKYQENKDDPNVMLEIENEFIKLDKEYLAGDESKVWLTSKTFNIHRKLMFGLYGSIESFGETDPTKRLVSITSNLDEGMKKKDLPALFNEARRGFFKRSVETALGGTTTKEIVRLLQTTEIIENDCGTTNGILVTITDINKDKYIFRNAIIRGKTILLTKDNISKYIGETITIRSPQYCKTKDGYCYKCCDYIWEVKRSKLLNIVPVAISSTIMMSSMKAMHGSKVTSYELKDLDKFLV